MLFNKTLVFCLGTPSRCEVGTPWPSMTATDASDGPDWEDSPVPSGPKSRLADSDGEGDAQGPSDDSMHPVNNAGVGGGAAKPQALRM